MSTRNYDFWVEWPRARLPVPDPSDRGIVRSEGEFGKSRPLSANITETPATFGISVGRRR